MPWGALDRYQAHYIVEIDAGDRVSDYVAKAVLKTEGRFGAKRVVSASWDGPGSLAARLNSDGELCKMVAALGDAGRIFVEPTDGAVRIRAGWDNHLAFGVTKEAFAVYDRIAGHIRSA